LKRRIFPQGAIVVAHRNFSCTLIGKIKHGFSEEIKLGGEKDHEKRNSSIGFDVCIGCCGATGCSIAYPDAGSAGPDFISCLKRLSD
jgi:hypothetical protein